jgi:hypothetical protein
MRRRNEPQRENDARVRQQRGFLAKSGNVWIGNETLSALYNIRTTGHCSKAGNNLSLNTRTGKSFLHKC